MSESPEERLSNHSGGKWTVCHQEFPKNEIIYLTQVVLIYIVVCACIYNLTSGQENQALWSSILSGCLGYMLPSPRLSSRTKNKRDQFDFPDGRQAQQQH